MFKKFCSGIFLVLMFIGCMSVYSLNKPAFKDASTVISTKPVKQIPRALYTVVTVHKWRFVSKS